MPYVGGELGKEIEDLMDKSNTKYNEGKYEECMILLKEAYDKIPGDKYKYDESYLIVWDILDLAIKIKDYETMEKWVNHIFYADPERIDSGEREMYAGRVAYELGDKSKAKEYFTIANTKSDGRCFKRDDKKYLEFYIDELNGE